MVDPKLSPPLWRVTIAFAVAPAAAAFAYACLIPLYAGLPDLADRVWRTFLAYLFFGGYPAAIVLGLPAFLALKNRVSPTPLNCGLVGAAVAAAPWLLLSLLPSPDYAYSNGHVTAENGARTPWGWIYLGVFVAQIAALGFFAGLVFWGVAALRFRRGR